MCSVWAGWRFFCSTPLLKTDHTIEKGTFVLLYETIRSPLCVYLQYTIYSGTSNITSVTEYLTEMAPGSLHCFQI